MTTKIHLKNIYLENCTGIVLSFNCSWQMLYMSQAQKWVQKRDDEILNFCNKWLFGMDAGRCADEPWQFFCTCAVVFLPKWWSR